jgi:RimJ/RimL family protein N-acetyltransferase
LVTTVQSDKETNQPQIITQRLSLRPFTPEDAKDVQKLAGNKNVSEQTLNIPYPYRDGMAEAWISNQTHNWKNGTEVIYAITDKNSKQLLGTVSLVKTDHSKAELGYWVGEPYWGRGYCTEAVKALFEFAFTNLDIGKIVAEHVRSNHTSGRVMEKTGMRRVGCTHRPDRNGKRSQMETYEMKNPRLPKKPRVHP